MISLNSGQVFLWARAAGFYVRCILCIMWYSQNIRDVLHLTFNDCYFLRRTYLWFPWMVTKIATFDANVLFQLCAAIWCESGVAFQIHIGLWVSLCHTYVGWLYRLDKHCIFLVYLNEPHFPPVFYVYSVWYGSVCVACIEFAIRLPWISVTVPYG